MKTQAVSAKPLKKRNMSAYLPYLFLFVLTNVIFIGLYRHFLLGHASYMYADIGNDSLSSSYPILALLSRLFHENTLTIYDLTAGLGTDISATYLQYINPLKLLMLLFPTDKLPLAIMVSTWIQVDLLALFGCLYFRQMLHHAWSAVLSALCWTFTGYVVLWGQNYSFLTCILLFTMTLYLLEMVLDGASLKITLWFMPVTALFLLSNYYFLYMTVVFALFYTLLRCLFIRVKPLDYLKRIARLVWLSVGGALMGAAAVPSILNTFFNSNRSEAVSEAASTLDRAFNLYSPADYLTMLGRVFSVNLFGPGSGYTGTLNYYEMVELSVSALFGFALIFLLIRKGKRLAVWLLVLLSAAGLSLPAFSKLFTMVEGNQRWGFCLCLLECLAIGCFIKALLNSICKSPNERCRENDPADTSDSRKALLATLVTTPLLTVVCMGLIFLGKQKGYYDLSPKMLLMTAAFFVFYELILICLLFVRSHRLLIASFLIILTGELFLVNNVTVNDRIYLPSDAFETSYYNDGSEDTLSAIREADSDLYRLSHPRETDPALYGISAPADNMFANEGEVLGYNGTTSYTSTQPASLSSYGRTYLCELGRTNFFILNYDNYYLYTLMGGRYVIGEYTNENVMAVDKDLYSVTDISGNDEQLVLENTSALPFGYLYEQEITDAAAFSDAGALDRMRLTTQGFISTELLDQASDDGTAAKAETAASEDDADAKGEAASSENDAAAFPSLNVTSFLKNDDTVSTFYLEDLITDSNDCTYSTASGQLIIEATGPDPFIICRIPEVPDEKACFLELSLSPATEGGQSCQVFYATSAQGLSGDFSRDITLSDDVTEHVTALPEDCQMLRLDTLPGRTVVFDAAALTICDPSKDLAALKASPVSSISFSSKNDEHTGIYAASVDVASDQAMLAVPLPYSRYWQAYVDDSPVDVSNINGGILGISLTQGQHSIRLVYTNDYIKIGILISLLACCGFVLLLILTCRKRK